MSNIPNAPSSQRPKKLTRHMLNTPRTVIALDGERTRRLVGTIDDITNENGVRHIDIVVPTSGGRGNEQRLDVSYLADVPALTQPFAEAMLAILSRASIRSGITRVGYVSRLRLGFIDYVKERHDPADFKLAYITTDVANDFVSWLRNQKWKKKSCINALGMLAAIIAALRDLPSGNDLPAKLRIPRGQFPGASRDYAPTRVLNEPDVAALYKACIDEVTSTMRSVAEDWRRMESARATVKTSSARDYNDLAVCLVTIDEDFSGGRIKKYKQLRRINQNLADAIKFRHGGIRALRCLHPYPRDLMPFALLFGLVFLYNPDVLLKLNHADFTTENILGVSYLRANPFKARAGQKQPRTIPVQWDDPTNPAVLLEFLKKWTARLRLVAPPLLRDRIFLYAPYRGNTNAVVNSWSRTKSNSWKHSLKLFLHDHNLPAWVGLRVLRATGLDLVHELSGGDLRAVIAMGGQRNPQTIHSHYTSDAARQKNDERLGGTMKIRERWVETGGQIDPTKEPQNEDHGCATPGWRCKDPYSSPQPGQSNGKLCTALGACPTCSLAEISLNSAYACARAYQLRHEIYAAQTYLPARRWLDAWAKRLEHLEKFWLPNFSDDVSERARRIHLSKFPHLE